MSISYLITVHNELEAGKVFSQLYPYANPLSPLYRGDEVVILDDYSSDIRMLKLLALWGDCIGCRVVKHKLDGDFGKHKQYGNEQCKNPWILQLDADEYLSSVLLENIHELLDLNPLVELYRIPRVNIVRGMTDEDIRKWGWNLSILTESHPIIETFVDDTSAEYQFLKKNNLIISEENVS